MAIFGYGPHDQFGMLAAGLARVLFPLVLILGLTGIVSGSSTATTTSPCRR
jgi:hypothetical protein